jgi:putative toxin-antitoxin system antitoxin component (TIGR02293 family)
MTQGAPMTFSGALEENREISRTVQILGGAKVLDRPVRSRLEAHDLIRRGLRAKVLDHLAKRMRARGYLEKAVGISVRTWQRHKESPNRRLSPEQSGRAWKFAEILGHATEIFGSLEEAEEWMERPAMALNARKPIDLLSTPAGVESVEDHLTRMEYGVYT